MFSDSLLLYLRYRLFYDWLLKILITLYSLTYKVFVIFGIRIYGLCLIMLKVFLIFSFLYICTFLVSCPLVTVYEFVICSGSYLFFVFRVIIVSSLSFWPLIEENFLPFGLSLLHFLLFLLTTWPFEHKIWVDLPGIFSFSFYSCKRTFSFVLHNNRLGVFFTMISSKNPSSFYLDPPLSLRSFLFFFLFPIYKSI